jgi:precorrin-6B methylase 2
MTSKLQEIFRTISLPLVVWQRFLFSRSSALRSTGWISSYISRKPVDSSGKPIPWMNYATVDFLNKRLKQDHDLFEWGSGFSTLYFADKCSTVTSIEYDKSWYELIKTQVPSNAEIIYQAYGHPAYSEAINRGDKKYNLIVVDGRERVKCFSNCFDHLKDDGVVILDDSSRDKYKDAYNIGKELGFKHLDIIGLKPRSHRVHQTTFFYRSENCLDI